MVYAQAAWAHQNGSLEANGAIIIKSQNGGSYPIQGNPFGSVAKSNLSAATQPPTVILKGGIPCFMGMPQSERSKYCVIGGKVMLDAFSTTVVGLYAGPYDYAGLKSMVIMGQNHPVGNRPWGCYYFGKADTGTSPYFGGLYFTSQIQKMMHSNGLCTSNAGTGAIYTESAANYCYALQSAGIGNNLWYLPTVDQMKLIAPNAPKLGFDLTSNYWTSTEFSQSTTLAKAIDLNTGAVVDTSKANYLPFRCATDM